MARSYKKVIKCGICTGSNTEFYRDRNRKARHLNKHGLRNLMAHYDIDDINDLIISYVLPHDSWDEPTDGTYIVTRNDKNKYYENYGAEYWNKYFARYLKSKRYKH